MPVVLINTLNDFQKNIQNSQKLINEVKKGKINPRYLEIIGELVFLKIYTEWEVFLEDSFVRYLVGGKSPSGYSPKCYICPPNMEIAKKILKGESKDYIKWNDVGLIKTRSKIYFRDGEPFVSALDPIIQYMEEMNIIRNRIAHKSDLSKSKFNDFIRRKFGHGISGITAGKLLLMKTTPRSRTTYLDIYIGVIDTASKSIIPQ
jgi:hypothetical protein